jgi:hypothetical protein
MTTPPTLNYATPARPNRTRQLFAVLRILVPCFLVFVAALHLFHAFLIILSVIVTHTAFAPSQIFYVSHATLSVFLFLAAAVRIHRHPRRWAVIALITVLGDLAIFLCGLRQDLLSHDFPDMSFVSIIIFAPFFILLLPLAVMLILLLLRPRSS